MKTDYRKSLDALERACQEVLDAETLKAVVAAKRRIQGEPEREIVSRRSIKIPIEIVPTCSMAAMREALLETQSVIAKCMEILTKIPGGVPYDGLIDDVADEICDLRASYVNPALSDPPRNCDRPECATTKSAQDVWRKEDGGKTAYYEWLLATSTKGGEK